MAKDQFKRKLTTILSADVAGYSRLMGEDEAATVKTLEQPFNRNFYARLGFIQTHQH